MSLDTTIAPSRRTLLGAAIGAAAATVAVTLERPLAAAAADGETIQVGGEYTSSSPTQITNQSNGQAAIVGIGSGSGLGVVGVSEAGYGVRGNSTSGRGVLADSSSGS